MYSGFRGLFVVRWFNRLKYILGQLPCEQRLHFRCVSWRAKSSHNRSNPSRNLDEWIKHGLFPVLDRLRALREACVGNQSCRNFFYYRETRAIWRQTWRLSLLANRRDEFRARRIENWTVVGRGYFSHASSHSETVASALRVYVSKLKLNIYPWVIFRNEKMSSTVKTDIVITQLKPKVYHGMTFSSMQTIQTALCFIWL